MAFDLKHHAIVGSINGLKLNPREVKITPGLNPRDLTTPGAIEKLAELKDSIRRFGVRTPILVRQIEEEIHVVNGHRRLTAVLQLINEGVEIDHIPALREPRGVSVADRDAGLIIDNDHSEPLTLLEKAIVVKRLVTYGWNRRKIADELGYKRTNFVQNCLLLAEAPPQLLLAVKREEIVPSAAIELIRRFGDKADEQLPRVRELAEQRGDPQISKADVEEVKKEAPVDVREPEEPKTTSESDTSTEPREPRKPKDQSEPKSSATTGEIEHRDEGRPAEFEDKAGLILGPDMLPGLRQVIEILVNFEQEGVSAEAAASAYASAHDARTSTDVGAVLGWFEDFCAALRLTEDGRVLRSPQVAPALIDSINPEWPLDRGASSISDDNSSARPVDASD